MTDKPDRLDPQGDFKGGLDKRLECWDKSLKPKDRNPHAKETFDKTMQRAALPARSNTETPLRPAGYTDTQTHSDNSEDTSG